MSDDLKAFLRAWLDWAEAGAPDDGRHTNRNPNRFERDCGLCSNTYNFEELALNVHLDDVGDLETELSSLFAADGMDKGYPFGYAAYDEDAAGHTQHLNPTRLAWVRKQLEA